MITIKRVISLLLCVCFLSVFTVTSEGMEGESDPSYIKWVDFTVPAPLMKQSLEWDLKNRRTDSETSQAGWIEILAYLGAKCSGSFEKIKSRTVEKLFKKLEEGETMESLSSELKSYDYYLKAYTAVLGGLAGEDGLSAFHPIAKGFSFSHYDDFGTGRNYGYKRRHLGHDLMAATGTPIVAVESGTVEELGWNRYGGWRIGIRSFDTKRYYYYAHMRQNRPYAEGLEKGGTVLAGDVIGYVGRTGYSTKENTNGIKTSHLHFGIQLIFNESQKDGPSEIWIDPFEITKLLASRRCEVVRNPETKEYTRKEEEPSVESLNTFPTVKIPVVMYHSIQKNRSKLGAYTISPDELEQDFKWLKENGYQTVTVDQLIQFSEGKSAEGSPLPEKPVFLSFDDGYYDNYFYADPLLREYGFTAAIFVVGEFIDVSEREGCQNPNYSYCDRNTLNRMAREGFWEIESHSYNLHHSGKGREGVKRRYGECDETYYSLLREDFSRIGELIEGVAGRLPRVFAYPLGAMSKEAEEVLREMGYKITLSCSLGVAEIKAGDTETLYKMKRILRPSGKPLSGLI